MPAPLIGLGGAALIGSTTLAGGLLGGKGAKKAAKEAAQAQLESARILAQIQKDTWERQFGPVSDAAQEKVLEMLGPGWLPKFRQGMRTEIESGIRPGEEMARNTLLDQIRANPRGMSGAATSRSLKDIAHQGAIGRGQAYRTGYTQTELAPINTALSFLGRQPFKPDIVIPPYIEPKYGQTGAGLFETINQGMNLYNQYKNMSQDQNPYNPTYTSYLPYGNYGGYQSPYLQNYGTHTFTPPDQISFET